MGKLLLSKGFTARVGPSNQNYDVKIIKNDFFT